MKGSSSSKVIMGAALVMVVTLAIVLALLLLLLAELYCSLLLRKRHHPKTASSYDEQPPHQPSAPSLCSFYAQGVLHAPRNFLFPAPENQLHLPIHHSSAPSPSGLPAEQGSPYSASTASAEQLIYICNPIFYDNDCEAITPFETPDTSPSRLDTAGGSPLSTPPLTPMKKLPPEGPSVSLRDARFICTTGSDSNFGISSSSSASPSTSPSW